VICQVSHYSSRENRKAKLIAWLPPSHPVIDHVGGLLAFAEADNLNPAFCDKVANSTLHRIQTSPHEFCQHTLRNHHRILMPHLGD